MCPHMRLYMCPRRAEETAGVKRRVQDGGKLAEGRVLRKCAEMPVRSRLLLHPGVCAVMEEMRQFGVWG